MTTRIRDSATQLVRTMTSEQTSDGLYSAKQAARFLGFCEVTLARWRNTGEGPTYIKIGRQVRYDPVALKDFVTKNSRASQDGQSVHSE